MKYKLMLVLTGLINIAQAQNSFPLTPDSSAGIGTTAPQFYFHGGNNLGMEIFNRNTASNSQAQLILSTGATANIGSVGTLTWVTPNSTGNKGVAYIAARTMQDATTNASGDLFFATSNGSTPTVKMRITAAGNVGIGNNDPRALFDVVTPVTNATTSVLGRMPEGDPGGGTYLGVQAYNTNPAGSISFALEHKFYGSLNSAINFHRGGSTNGGFISFSTSTGIERMRIDALGNVGIGTTTTGNYKLTVEGTIGARRLKITQSLTWADFVFDPGYHLLPLQELESYVKTNKHLPDVPSAEDVAKEGFDVGEMNKILLQKVEELTLHLIEEHKQLEALKKEMEVLKRTVKE